MIGAGEAGSRLARRDHPGIQGRHRKPAAPADPTGPGRRTRPTPAGRQMQRSQALMRRSATHPAG
jgi:hypothetical protein